MERYLEENFGGVQAKNSEEEALDRWRRPALGSASLAVVNHKLRVAVHVSKAALQFIYDLSPRDNAQSGTSLFQPSQWKRGDHIGSGSFGHVHLGVNSENQELCAIKEVNLAYSCTKEQLEQLKQEIHVLSQLTHHNIIQYYGSNMSDDAISIYIEYAPNGSIQKFLSDNGGPLKEPMIRDYTAQILSGIAYLHQRKIVHRDIKGANILVGLDGVVKLADFGMAKHVSSFAGAHSMKGTVYWMAPEVILGPQSDKGYNGAVDIWSLGCTVIEMATARHPWHPLEPVQAMFRIAVKKDTPQIPDTLSDEGKSFLQLCFNHDPATRPTAIQLMDHPFVREFA
ncbi:hypothetical protein EJB05_54722 [Eragrostis curvula]|uniref:mitogen-activated protein kinase kinase kinase n=1 Tax=Eragrostis curvula TaxID=38414 RepID=A0A5J9SLJ6_9POAL|nr:hypothetical protein EJB05_54722 [Eragrostis curvula]